ncbi:MAG TPA: hypothetical protein VF587_04305 [Solirubrobacteraceae bacterium]|jgi:hypothetical protein
MNSHRRLRYGAALLGGAPLLLILGLPAWGALALGVAGALVVLSALNPGRRGP